MRRNWSSLAGLLLLAAVVGGCHPSWPPVASPGKSACDDPCRAMTCPTGSRCVWNDSCQPTCTAEYPPAGWKP